MLPQILKWVSPVIVLIGCVHLMLGVQAEVMLGAVISPQTLNDPVLDSQNRFYGIAFTSYGFLLFLCATDLLKYKTVLKVLLAVFFAGGVARVVSIFVVGVPTEIVLLLLAAEMILPPVVWVWLNQHLANLRLNKVHEPHE